MCSPCPECGSNNISCRVKEDDYSDEYKARMECDDCSYYMRWTRKTFERKSRAESEAEDEWNDPSFHY